MGRWAARTGKRREHHVHRTSSVIFSWTSVDHPDGAPRNPAMPDAVAAVRRTSRVQPHARSHLDDVPLGIASGHAEPRGGMSAVSVLRYWIEVRDPQACGHAALAAPNRVGVVVDADLARGVPSAGRFGRQPSSRARVPASRRSASSTQPLICLAWTKFVAGRRRSFATFAVGPRERRGDRGGGRPWQPGPPNALHCRRSASTATPRIERQNYTASARNYTLLTRRPMLARSFNGVSCSSPGTFFAHGRARARSVCKVTDRVSQFHIKKSQRFWIPCRLAFGECALVVLQTVTTMGACSRAIGSLSIVN